jgi:D-apionolactonase
MKDVAAERRLTGRDRARPAPLELRAGPVTALLDGADLRRVRAGGVELVQRVYVAVRDAPWNTIPATFEDWHQDIGPDRFRITFRASHRYEAIAFDWDGTITGGPDGVIRYTMDGRCHGVFAYSKIGFNVHHALEGSVGRPYLAMTPDGPLTGVLPELIAPQRIVDGTLSGMFAPYSELAIEVTDGLEAVIALDGDLLELQDHRNWTDANFKSYGTPLALGFPFDSTDGQRIHQGLTITARGEIPSAEPLADPIVRVASSVDGPLPAIGLGSAADEAAWTEREVGLLRQARPAHLRVDLALGEDGWRAVLSGAMAKAASLDTALELALSVNERQGEALSTLAGELARGGPVARVLIYQASDGFSAMLSLTPAALVRLVRERLEPVTGPVVFAGGTNQNFSDINRDRPTDLALTGVCFSISPTVHAADDASIIENQGGAGEVVRMARSFSGDRAVCVSPVTIATRFGPYPAGPAAPGDLPPSVDVRQASLLGAAWLVGELKHLAEAGAASVTLFEATGWRGIIETATGSPMPERFPSSPGEVFPIFHVLADLAEWRDGGTLPTQSSDPLRAVALAVETPDGGRHVLVANVTRLGQRVVVEGLPDGTVRRRDLDAGAAELAATDPATFRASGADTTVAGGRIVLELAPYAVARLDPS